MSNTGFTDIENLGEFGLIDHLTMNLPVKNKSTVKAIGDDSAVIDYKNNLCVTSTDMLVEGVHFDLTYFPLQHLGYKAVIAGISDIYAMNAIAEQILISVALSNQFSVEMMEEIYRGMKAACENYNVDLVGGDTTTSRSGLVINVTAFGKAKKDDIVYRNGASKNDLIFVTGDLGAAYLGLLILEREKKVFLENENIQPKLDDYQYILQRQLKPEARKDVIQTIKKLGVKPTSMMDISDGLSSELLHLCKQSGYGCRIFEEKIPIDPSAYNTARELGIDPTTCMLNGGEDYELVFTIPQKDYEKLENHPDFTAIGHIGNSESDHRLITKSGNEYQLKAQGWKAFSK